MSGPAEPPESSESADPASGHGTAPTPDIPATADSARGHRRARGGRVSTRRLAVLVSAAVVLLGVLAVAWLAVTALLARSQLTAVKQELPQLRQAISSGDFDQARTIADQLGTHARRAHALTTGPAWWVSANLPYAGAPLQTARVIAAQADAVGQTVLPGVLELADNLSGSQLRHGDTIDLTTIAKAAPVLDTAATTAAHATSAVAGTSSSTWLAPIDDARDTVLSDLSEISGQLSGADNTVQTALPMLGQGGLRRYFIGFQNEAEARGLGGLPGAFAIVTADHGTVAITHIESDTALDNVRADVDLGNDFDARYGTSDPTGTYLNSDISPDFRDAAQIWASMWQQKSGEHVDGAFALDPTALGYLLQVTGPAALPDGTSVSADNVVDLTEKDQYAKYPAVDQIVQRKQFLVGVAKAVASKLLSGDGNTLDLVRAVARAADERRFVVWTADPQTERRILSADYGGALPAGGQPAAGFVVVNAAGTKLDYYLQRTMSYHRNGCGSAGTATATFVLHNAAPTSGLPSYVTTRSDKPGYATKAGDTRLLVTYYGSAGATIGTVRLDGKPVQAVRTPEKGLVTATVDVELPVGSTRTLTVAVSEPASSAPLQVLRQPGVNPLTVNVSGSAC